MRKQDRNKNIEQANLMLEQSYLKSKGLLKENMYGDTSNKYGNHGVGKADSPANTGGGEVTVKKPEETVEHTKSGMEVNVYSNGIIEFCKGGKMVDAYKYQSDFSRHGGFKAVKDYFEENPEEDITKIDVFNNSRMKNAGTLLKSRELPSRAVCGEVSKFNDSSWVR